MSFTVEKCKSKGEWNQLLENGINKTLFHSWEWLKIIEKHTGAKLHPLVASHGENQVCILPTFFSKHKGLRVAMSPPTKAGLISLGPLLLQFNKVIKQQAIESTYLFAIDSLDSYIKEKLKPNYTRISASPYYEDARPYLWNKYQVTPQYTYLLDLSPSEDEIFENFQKQLRVDLKKTEREGVEVKEGGLNEMGLIHKSLSERFVQQGLKTNLTYAYLKELYDTFHPDRLRIFVAYYGGEFVGGFISVIHPNRATYWAGGSKTQIPGIYPNDLLQWEAIKWAKQQGLKNYEIVGAEDKRLRHFKSKFNPELVIWFQAEKYFPPQLKHIESPVRGIISKIKMGGIF